MECACAVAEALLGVAVVHGSVFIVLEIYHVCVFAGSTVFVKFWCTIIFLFYVCISAVHVLPIIMM